MSVLEQHLPRKTVATYALGSMGTGGFATLPGLVLIYYMTDTLGIAAIAAGLLVTLAKVWDVLIDPVIGARSDHDLASTGSRERFMVLGGMLLPVFFLLTFAVPTAMGPWRPASGYLSPSPPRQPHSACFRCPILPARRTDPGVRPADQVALDQGLGALGGNLVFGAGGPALRSLGGENKWLGYFLMALACGVLIGVSMLLAARVAPRSKKPAIRT